ncbi:capsule assembly Wzi family protein [Shewanella glacialipiscicola]|uniref:capsule assembly Wzi family protein n=1 Tax=Shewanella glacialipiscicola TaxID=614069 RepID=UPI001BC2F909|nr:capsule assembly Wzi family protein [Shewanella glacialipiscicola]MCL1087355.1 capsule assembly Wzi family protein [Shewanella glacialipiscicola]MCU7995909.1 capsule assembly Wzi family protein [Shewanella glacialipiscicola]MCU8027162.1 capsule assembly Wzi family protein [Shewanella glacialipiscicola]GIU08090.1 outer membrane protein in capsule/EPS biosynthesis locus [Shewanella glacialipiscicola]
MKAVFTPTLLATSVATGLFFSSVLAAAPWVDASDIYLRADIQALADAGVITVPVNTYPLMWSGIGGDLAKVEPELLSASLVQAFARVNFYYQNAVDNHGNARIKVTAASDPARFRHYGSDYREKGEVLGSYEYLGSRIAYKTTVAETYDPQDSENFRLDESYFAIIFGNWIATLGSVEQWWGPGFDSALHRSNNARSMPSLTLSRNNASAFETPWLSWIGPWTFKSGFSLMEADRAVPKTAEWDMRLSARPIKQLEIGLSWSTLFCGEGQDCNFDSWWDSVTSSPVCIDGADNCAPDQRRDAGHRTQSIDMRYADTLGNIPVGLYLERSCENGSDCGSLWGIDTHFGTTAKQFKFFIEYSDTYVKCDGDSANCFYEDPVYLSGSRYYDRALGSTYDSDAQVFVVGLVGQLTNSRGFTSLLRYAQLNKDGSNVATTWAPQPLKEDLLMLELSYRMPLWKGMWSLGGTVSKSEFEAEDNDTNATLFSSFEYRF